MDQKSEVPDNGLMIKPPAPRSHVVCMEPVALGNEVIMQQDHFAIRLADTEVGRNSASMLINKMYGWRGYGDKHKVEENPNRITLSATDKGNVIGTVTIGIDSDAGILADEIFHDEIQKVRLRGGKVCEITKLAFDPTLRSKMALASLFHVLFIYAHYRHHCTDVFIEVNPRHRRYYEAMLGFQAVCDVRTNPRVDAPAYLLWVSMAHVNAEIARLGGTSDHPGNERSLYPYFLSRREESGLANRLLKLDQPTG
ncbi:N-acyl amino acid synthase FeeM domain-containing protein [Pseudoduganella rivuli]|nr:N-acetyltransferase [Pseudoduganella rivuli]